MPRQHCSDSGFSIAVIWVGSAAGVNGVCVCMCVFALNWPPVCAVCLNHEVVCVPTSDSDGSRPRI